MPTLDEWQNALLMERKIKVISDTALTQAVNKRPNSKSHKGQRKQALLVPEIAPHQYTSIMPIELLGAMGLIVTPRIDNLVDLCSTWARIRYIWAFDPGPVNMRPLSQRLRLSREALGIDFHQKTVLSDEIGMGMAALIMDKFLNAYNPIDVDLALRQSRIQGLNQIEDASPDFIFQNKTDNSYMIVECKGTQSGYNTAIRQLQRGTEQVRSLRFASSVTPSYVVATEISEEYTHVYVIDPPNDSDESNNKSEITIRNKLVFYETVQDIQAANIFRYIGAFGRAYQLDVVKETQHREVRIYDPPSEVYVEELRTSFVGVQQELRIPGEFGSIAIFQGIPEQIFLTLTARSYDEAERTTEAFFSVVSKLSRKTESNKSPGHFSVHRSDKNLLVRLFRREGTMLQIEIKP